MALVGEVADCHLDPERAERPVRVGRTDEGTYLSIRCRQFAGDDLAERMIGTDDHDGHGWTVAEGGSRKTEDARDARRLDATRRGVLANSMLDAT